MCRVVRAVVCSTCVLPWVCCGALNRSCHCSVALVLLLLPCDLCLCDRDYSAVRSEKIAACLSGAGSSLVGTCVSRRCFLSGLRNKQRSPPFWQAGAQYCPPPGRSFPLDHRRGRRCALRCLPGSRRARRRVTVRSSTYRLLTLVGQPSSERARAV